MKYETPDMAIIEPELIEQYEVLASSTAPGSCISISTVTCTGSGGVNVCISNTAGCGKASYCTTKSS